MDHCDRPPAFKIERGCVAACRHFDFTKHVCSFDRQHPCDLRKMETCQRCERFTLDQLDAMDQAAVEGTDHRVNRKLVKHHFESPPEIDEELDDGSATPEDIEGFTGYAVRDWEEA
jgi:hypothetical protein